MTEKWEKLSLWWILVRKWLVITGQRDFILKLLQNGSPSASRFNGLCLVSFKKLKNILLLTDCTTHFIYVWIKKSLRTLCTIKGGIEEATMQPVVLTSCMQVCVHIGALTGPRRAQWQHLFTGTILHRKSNALQLTYSTGHLIPSCFLNRR